MEAKDIIKQYQILNNIIEEDLATRPR